MKLILFVIKHHFWFNAPMFLGDSPDVCCIYAPFLPWLSQAKSQRFHCQTTNVHRSCWLIVVQMFLSTNLKMKKKITMFLLGA